MFRLRKILVAAPIATAVAGLVLAATPAPANALIPASDCGGYVIQYTWWSDAALNEWEQHGTTAYYNYARDKSFYYSNLFATYC